MDVLCAIRQIEIVAIMQIEILDQGSQDQHFDSIFLTKTKSNLEKKVGAFLEQNCFYPNFDLKSIAKMGFLNKLC